jgi:drug/metabolite transporter (DMT)-like permease
VVLGVAVLGERLGPWQIVGFVIVLGAAWVINRRPRTPEAVAVPEQVKPVSAPR